jgi:hypothetical protein
MTRHHLKTAVLPDIHITMKNSFLGLCSILALVTALLTGCISSGGRAVIPPGATPLSALELRELFATSPTFDNGWSGGVSYTVRPSGDMTFTSRTFTSRQISGRWALRGDQFGYQIEDSEWTYATIYRVSPDTFYFDNPASNAKDNTLRLRR